MLMYRIRERHTNQRGGNQHIQLSLIPTSLPLPPLLTHNKCLTQRLPPRLNLSLNPSYYISFLTTLQCLPLIQAKNLCILSAESPISSIDIKPKHPRLLESYRHALSPASAPKAEAAHEIYLPCVPGGQILATRSSYFSLKLYFQGLFFFFLKKRVFVQ